MYTVILQTQKGGEQNVLTTADRQYAACYCKCRNDFNRRQGSPNRYHFEESQEL